MNPKAPIDGSPFGGKRKKKNIKALKVLFICCGLLPTVWLLWRAAIGGLGADPVMKIIHTTGDWALNFLVLALALRAFKAIPSTVYVNLLHGISGFFAFYYVSLHFSSYVVLDQFFNFSDILEDVSRHRRIIVGFAGFLMLGTVSVTSLKGVMAKIGFHRWRRVHGFTYLVPVCAVVHYLWLVKKDIRIPLVYTVIVVFLIGYKQLRKLYSSA